MAILVVGINHKTAPIEIREKFYLSVRERELLLSELRNDPSVIEAIVLSTCNRTEIYAHSISQDGEALLKHLFGLKGLDFASGLQKHFYAYQGQEAVKHLLRVSTGLDSLILGEQQILGQFKEAVDLSRQKTMLSREFNILSQIAIRAGKKAQSETQISCGGSSVSWAAVNMIEKKFKALGDKSVLIIGAGKMGYLAVNYLKEKGIRSIYIMNRTQEHSLSLAQETGSMAVPFWDIKKALSAVDACICSTSCPHYLIEKDLVSDVMAERSHQPLLLIDISMPRNINPEASSVLNVSVVAIDDLEKVREGNAKKRSEAVSQVEEIIFKKMGEYYNKVSKISSGTVSLLENPVGIGPTE